MDVKQVMLVIKIEEILQPDQEKWKVKEIGQNLPIKIEETKEPLPKEEYMI